MFFVTFLLLLLTSLSWQWGCSSFTTNRRLYPFGTRNSGRSVGISAVSTAREPDEDRSLSAVVVKAAVACGFAPSEMNPLRKLIQSNFQAFGFECRFNDDISQVMPKAESPRVNGPTGRILVLTFPGQVDEGTLEDLSTAVAATVDEDLYSESPQLTDPFLLRFEHQDNEDNLLEAMASIVEQVVQEGELQIPLPRSDDTNRTDVSFTPSEVVEVDGAWIEEPDSAAPTWDTSSILVFDGLVNHDLRNRLAQVLGGGKDLTGCHNPDPQRWERGGLSDRLDGNDHDDTSSSSSYGLTYQAIQELCFQHHDPIQEMETIFSDLFPQFIITRLPEAVFGESVSPLTANAPVTGDIFDYHIDADPYMTPPSLWTDVYGRYPNRSHGKPRFISFLVYLNDEWREEWGGPTRFLDVATDTEYSVTPQPGRCILMDQDVTHSVTAPVGGERPRYSLVWKLVLHPRQANQDMRDLAGGRSWPEPTLLGSAACSTTSWR